MKKEIVFVLDHGLKAYRLEFFKQLQDKGYKITVIHPGKPMEGANFIEQKKSELKFQFLGFEYRSNLPKQNAAIIVYMQNIRVINLWLTTLNILQKPKVIHWGIGVSSAKGLSLTKTMTSRLRNTLSKQADAVILYTDFPLALFSKSVRAKTFIANNTVYNPNPQDFSGCSKTSFIFIGTLNERKGLDILLQSFATFLTHQKSEIELIIIGDGPEHNNLQDLVEDLNLRKHVVFTGVIVEQAIKEQYFKNAIASISPKQAGLSVLESFSYGVPFIAYKNAISGGEHLNIKSGYNGYLVDSQEELTLKLVEMYKNQELSEKLGHNAFKYYKEKRQMKHMVNIFNEAFEFVLKI